MELRHLLYFKTVAEELHFRKAASRLFISQPPLSRQIKELEEELGVKLFERNNKRVILTDAGKYLKEQAEKVLGQLEESRHMVKQIHEDVSGRLRIGYISSTYQNHLINVLKEIPAVFPLVKTKLFEVSTTRQIKALEEGKLDVGIMRTPVDSEKLKVVRLFSDPFVVVIPGKERIFSGLKEISHFIKNQHFIFFNQEYAPEYHRKLIEVCQRLGFTPEVVHEANNVHSILRLVENGLGVSVVPHSLRDQYSYLNVSFLDMPEISVSTEVVMAFRDQLPYPPAEWFIKKFSSFFDSK